MNTIKNYLLILSTLFFVEIEASTPPMGMGICRELAAELTVVFFERGEEPPTTWEEFPSIRVTQEEKLGSMFRMKWLNSFALIPEQPVLDSERGLPKEYNGLRLYLMSRNPEPNRSGTSQGRLVIFLSDGEQDQKGLIPLTRYIPETLASKILEQLGGYDLNKEPVAFSREFVEQIEVKNRRDKVHFKEIIAGFEEREKRIEGNHQGATAESDRPRVQVIWIMIIILVLVTIAWAVIRAQKNRA